MRHTEKANAKINLYLNVVAQRHDGFHDIESVMQTIDLCDVLHFDLSPSDITEISLTFSVPSVLPVDEQNLIVRAALAFLAAANKTAKINVLVEKSIPMEAGLGGGSSDAAATLLALDRLYQTAMPLDKMCAIAARLGADIPFCVKKGTVYATGIGEVMESAPPMPDCAFVIAIPKGKGISTGAAYRAMDALPSDTETVRFEDFRKAVSACDLDKISALLYNKFELVTPAETGCAALREMLMETGAIGARMSGSGTAVFAIYPHVGAARKAKEALPEAFEAFVCTPARRDYPYIEA